MSDRADEHLDAVLRASGSALAHYSLPGTLAKMRAAMDAALSAARREERAEISAWLRGKPKLEFPTHLAEELDEMT